MSKHVFVVIHIYVLICHNIPSEHLTLDATSAFNLVRTNGNCNCSRGLRWESCNAFLVMRGYH